MPLLIELSDSDAAWPAWFAREAVLIRDALGDRALLLEHVGSTSVPGLAAKPRIDIVLAVADTRDEAAYAPALEAAGYGFHHRDPPWHEHRLFKRASPDANLHCFSTGCVEIARMLAFRDWLRAHPDDRALYERTKRELAAREWPTVQHYANAKTAVVEAILARAIP